MNISTLTNDERPVLVRVEPLDLWVEPWLAKILTAEEANELMADCQEYITDEDLV